MDAINRKQQNWNSSGSSSNIIEIQNRQIYMHSESIEANGSVGELGAWKFILAFHTFQLRNNKLENEFSSIRFSTCSLNHLNYIFKYLFFYWKKFYKLIHSCRIDVTVIKSVRVWEREMWNSIEIVCCI